MSAYAAEIEARALTAWAIAKAQNNDIRQLCTMYREPLIHSIWKCGFCDGAIAALQSIQTDLPAPKL